MLGKRIINTATGAAAACTTDTVQILDGVPFQSIATYQLDGNANDLTGNYNGTASNVTYTTGKFGQAAVFNGSSSYITLTQPVNLSTDNFTYSFWIYPTTNIGYGTPLSQYGGTTANQNFYSYRDGSTEKITFGLVSTGGSFNQLISTGTTPLNQWTHVALVRDSSTQKIYLNGQLSGTLSNTSTTSTSSEPFLIGDTNATPTDEFFEGSIDQVRIYNKALSADNVATLYAETVATASTNISLDAPSLVAYYKMSDATDETGSYDGTPTDVNFNVAGKFGNAGEFNGSSSYIDLGNIINTTYVTPTGSFSTSVWVNFLSVGSSIQQIINSSTNANIELALNGVSQGAGKIVLSLWNGSYVHLISTTTVVTNTWYHIAVTHNNGSWSLYINGSSEATGTKTIVQPTTEPLVLGKRQNNTQYLNGKIDQVRIFNRAITATEVETLYDEVQCIPTIVPTDYFNTVLYQGDGTSSNPRTDVGFQPDFVWIKNRSTNQQNPVVFDSVRGVQRELRTDSMPIEQNWTTTIYSLKSFDNNGFTVGDIAAGNYNVNGAVGGTYSGAAQFVAWNWKAAGYSNTFNLLENGSTTSSATAAGAGITAGSITTGWSVSANRDAGFSIVKYTGNLTASTVGTGLSSAAELIIVKRTDSTSNWFVYSQTIGNTKYLNLDTSGAAATFNVWNNTSPTSSVFSLAAQGDVNASGGSYIAYCFHSVDGYSKIGSYVGTGAAGNFINVGFKPRFILLKNTSSGTNGDGWFMFDTTRSGSDVINVNLQANISDAESGPYAYTITVSSTGFEPTGGFANFTGTNASGQTYIFLAIAEEVFVPDNFFNDDSTVATYKLDGNAGDDSGNGYNGTASNVTYAAGKFDEAAVFNGSSSYISADNILDTSSAFTYSLWINPTTISSLDFLIGHQQAGSPYAGISLLGSGSNKLFLSISGGTAQDMTPTLTLGSWSHIVLTHDGSGNYTCYTNNNGSPITYSGATSNNSSNPFRIGFSSVGGWGYFDGKVDQVRIFNRALDSGEVAQLYNE